MNSRRSRSFPSIAAAVLLLALIPGCGVQRTIVRSTMNPILEGGMEALLAEPNLEIARTALASDLKLVEGMLRSDPGNSKLLLFAAQGYTAYSLAFVEDDDPAAARELYTRACGYANRWLVATAGRDLLAIDSLDVFRAAVVELDPSALPGIFWLGNSWGSEILLGLDDIGLVSQLPKVEILMQRVLELDPGYFFGLAHLFFGGYYGARPPLLGGDLEKARQHIQTQIELTHGQMLLGYLFEVKYVHLRRLDEQASRQTLRRILDFDLFSAPENTVLLNRVAQAKASWLLENLDNYL